MNKLTDQEIKLGVYICPNYGLTYKIGINNDKELTYRIVKEEIIHMQLQINDNNLNNFVINELNDILKSLNSAKNLLYGDNCVIKPYIFQAEGKLNTIKNLLSIDKGDD